MERCWEDGEPRLRGRAAEFADGELDRLNDRAREMATIVSRGETRLATNPFGPYFHRLGRVLAGGNRADAHALLLDLEDVETRLRGRLQAPPEGDGDREVSRRAGAMLFLDFIVETRRSVERAWPGLGRESLDRAGR
jgi:hypothetical protein